MNLKSMLAGILGGWLVFCGLWGGIALWRIRPTFLFFAIYALGMLFAHLRGNR